MPDITDPTVTTYVNEAIRPLADILVGLSSALDVEIARYNAVIAPLLTGNTGPDEIIDGAASDGRVVLNLTDLQNFITQITTIQTQFDGGGVFDVISKPHSNPRNL